MVNLPEVLMRDSRPQPPLKDSKGRPLPMSTVWNSSHHISFSKDNPSVNPNARSYFDRVREIPDCSRKPGTDLREEGKKRRARQPLAPMWRLEPPHVLRALRMQEELEMRNSKTSTNERGLPVTKDDVNKELIWNQTHSAVFSQGNQELHPGYRSYFDRFRDIPSFGIPLPDDRGLGPQRPFPSIGLRPVWKLDSLMEASTRSTQSSSIKESPFRSTSGEELLGWDQRHHISFSKGNHELHLNLRSYFDRQRDVPPPGSLSPEHSQSESHSRTSLKNRSSLTSVSKKALTAGTSTAMLTDKPSETLGPEEMSRSERKLTVSWRLGPLPLSEKKKIRNAHLFFEPVEVPGTRSFKEPTLSRAERSLKLTKSAARKSKESVPSPEKSIEDKRPAEIDVPTTPKKSQEKPKKAVKVKKSKSKNE